MKTKSAVVLALTFALAGAFQAYAQNTVTLPKPVPPFPGKIGATYKE